MNGKIVVWFEYELLLNFIKELQFSYLCNLKLEIYLFSNDIKQFYFGLTSIKIQTHFKFKKKKIEGK